MKSTSFRMKLNVILVSFGLNRAYVGRRNYVMSGVIDGFPEMSAPIGLKDIVKKPQLKGLWTWTRGGGWWGPYLHGNEQWVDLHAVGAYYSDLSIARHVYQYSFDLFAAAGAGTVVELSAGGAHAAYCTFNGRFFLDLSIENAEIMENSP